MDFQVKEVKTKEVYQVIWKLNNSRWGGENEIKNKMTKQITKFASIAITTSSTLSKELELFLLSSNSPV